MAWAAIAERFAVRFVGKRPYGTQSAAFGLYQTHTSCGMMVWGIGTAISSHIARIPCPFRKAIKNGKGWKVSI